MEWLQLPETKIQQKLFNPFIFRTPVRGNDFFGRNRLLQKLFRYIQVGESVSLVGERRTGKTSILLRVLDLKEQYLGQPEQHIFVLVDFLGLDSRSEASTWITLLAALQEEMERTGLETQAVAEAIDQLRSSELVFQPFLLRLFRRLTQRGLRVTFLFDEFEATIQNKHSVDLGFYKILRNLALDKGTKLTYVIATRQELSKVEKALERRFTSLSSPLFNIFHTLVIPPFSEDSAQQMVSHLVENTDLDLSAKLGFWQQRELLFQLSGFHPFFLQIACHELFEHCVLPDGTFAERVPTDEVISAFLAEANSHFDYYWDISSLEEQRLMAQLAVGVVDADVQSYRPVLNSLHNRCLVARETDAKPEWRLFSSAFARWIQEEQQLAAWYEKGMAQLVADEREQARETFEKVYQRQPGYRDVADQLGQIERESRREEQDERVRIVWPWLLGIATLVLCIGAALIAGVLPFSNRPTQTPTAPTPTDEMAIASAKTATAAKSTALVEAAIATASRLTQTAEAANTTAAAEATANAEATAAAQAGTATAIAATLTAEAATDTPTPDLTATWVASCVPQLELVSAQTIPGRADWYPGARFTQVWQLENTNQCPWPRNSRLIFDSGEQMEGNSPQELDELTGLIETTTISLSLTAPVQAGTYKSRWQVTNANGDPINESLPLSWNVQRGYFRQFISKKSIPLFACNSR